ncbi:MAG: hypothetical protein AAFR61_29765 [Bacteroidota bacterium]
MGYLAPNGQSIADLYELGYAPYSLEHQTRERFAERKSVVIDSATAKDSTDSKGSDRGSRDIFETVRRESFQIQEVAMKRIDSIWIEIELSAQK